MSSNIKKYPLCTDKKLFHRINHIFFHLYGVVFFFIKLLMVFLAKLENTRGKT